MKEIRIVSLELSNFKCHKHLRLDFNGNNMVIRGDNATGKTSVYDSLLWLLFDKDSSGNGSKNFEIKPLGADGEVLDHDALTSVEAVLMVRDGARVTEATPLNPPLKGGQSTGDIGSAYMGASGMPRATGTEGVCPI